MIFVGASSFVSCSNGSDSSSTPPAEQTTPLSETATVSEVAAVETTGTAAVSGSTATLSATNGTYLLTESASSSASVSTVISASEAPSTKKGTWKFTESGKTTPKYAGSYTGSIGTIGSNATSLTLKVEKIVNNGVLSAVVDVKTIDMDIPASGTFNATIPAVKVSSVTSYMSSKMDVQYNSATNYNIYSNNERIDLADGKITYNAVASRKNLTNGTSAGDIENNSYQFKSGTYTISNGTLTGTVGGKTLSFTIDADGNLATNEGVAFYLISGSYKLYANCVSVADGNNSYAQQKYVTFCEDSGKTGQVIDIKAFVPGQGSTIRNFKDITYEKSGNTMTLKFSDSTTKTATFSADGKTLTLDGVVYTKL
ncbi:MAG: hypothetical protein IK015_01035 [Treponema sp.]|nr:hypothetical protein [Treponema sp.]